MPGGQATILADMHRNLYHPPIASMPRHPPISITTIKPATPTATVATTTTSTPGKRTHIRSIII